MHLTLDGITRELADPYLTVRTWLLETPARIGMTPIVDSVTGEPRLVVTRVKNQVHGIAFIAESHLAVHLQERIINLDVFSCKEFDEIPVVQEALQRFSILPGWRVHLDPHRLELTTAPAGTYLPSSFGAHT